MSSWKKDLENIGIVEEISVMFEIQSLFVSSGVRPEWRRAAPRAGPQYFAQG
jgi:hypothetical protein